MFQPSQKQQWDPIEGFRPALGNQTAQRELRGWSLLALGALAIAGVYALLLAISRIPGADNIFPWPVAFYEKSLIIHVVFSFVIWFLAAAIIFMHIATYRTSEGTPDLSSMGRVAFAAMFVSFICLAVPALMDRGIPSINNYVPAITDPVYYIGLLLAGFAGILMAVRTIINVSRRTGPLEPLGTTGLASAVIVIIAMTAFALSWNRLGGMPTIAADNEDLFWAGGHILQFLNTTVMMGAWVLLGGRAFGQPLMAPRTAMLALAINALLSIGGMALMFIEQPFSAEEHALFTHYQYALAPAPVLVGIFAIRALMRMPALDSEPARTARVTLALSLTLFFAGGFMGIFVDGADTRTPAHYHGVIGAVNLAFMAFMVLFVLPVLERGLVRWKVIRVAFWLYGLGQLLHSSGLFVAGGYGAPRKVADTAPSFDDILNWTGHLGIGVGGVIAVIGGIIFIWVTGRRLIKRSI